MVNQNYEQVNFRVYCFILNDSYKQRYSQSHTYDNQFYYINITS